ncbi:hypothetical protein A7982_13894 [Minicystis rosea]|nr:hypothetical protein A7982_13894 [Minicystis rosea]
MNVKRVSWVLDDPDFGKPYVSAVDSIGPLTKLNDAPIAAAAFTIAQHGGMVSGSSIAAVDALGRVGQPRSAVWFQQAYPGFFEGDWHP